MRLLIIALPSLAIGIAIGVGLCAFFTGVYDNEDLDRAYSAGFDAGRKAGGSGENETC